MKRVAVWERKMRTMRKASVGRTLVCARDGVGTRSFGTLRGDVPSMVGMIRFERAITKTFPRGGDMGETPVDLGHCDGSRLLPCMCMYVYVCVFARCISRERACCHSIPSLRSPSQSRHPKGGKTERLLDE